MSYAIARHFDRSVLTRIALAGGGWGLVMATGFLAMNAPQCGLPCPTDVVVTAALCVGAGVLTIGPFAALVARR